MRKGRLVALAVVMLAALPAEASAHANLVRTIPGDRSVLASAPRQVSFVFDDEIRPGPGIEAVRNGDGSVLAGKARSSDKTLIVPLEPRLEDGDYSVRWSVISDDGHEIGGVTAFAVGSGRAPPVPGLSPGSTAPGAATIVARWLFFLGLLAAAGSAVFFMAVWLPEAGDDAELEESERRVGSLLLAGCLALAAAGAVLLLWLSHATVETRFGRVVTGGAIIAGIGCVTALGSVRLRILRPVALLAALTLLPLPTLSGHALDPGRSKLDVVVDVAHVTAAAVWLGGLLSLALAVPRATRMLQGPARSALRGSLARRFSTLALASVALLAGTGVWRAIVELGPVSQLWTTGYGRAILIKSGLLVVILALAVRNRYLLLDGPFARLRAGVVGESVVLLGVVVAVAFLTDLPPGRTASAAPPAVRPGVPASRPALPKLPPKDAVVLAKQDGRLAVGLAARPAGARTAVQATVVGPSNTGVKGLRVSFNGKPAAPCGSGCYRAVIPGSPRVNVVVSGRTLRFDLSSRAQKATALVRRATRAFRKLRSVSYVERLASGPGRAVVSRWRLEAPDRLEYKIRGGTAGIVIGKRRWDRTGRRWIPSPSQRLRMPAPTWGSADANAHVLESQGSFVVVSLLNRSLPAWFTIRFDRRTLLPRSLDMAAAAHFMRHRYTSFNRPLQIRPPK